MTLNTAGPRNQASPSNKKADPAGPDDDNHWMIMSRDAHQTSEDWFDAAVRNDMERNIAHFQGRHAPGSKYEDQSYKFRAKGFRPKTRTVLQRHEALAATAFFGTRDVMDIRAEDEASMVQRVSANINKELLQYRLENTIPWFQTLMGAFQKCNVEGIAISHQYWDYEEQIQLIPLYGDDGQQVVDDEGEYQYEEKRIPIKDTPAVDLRPIENVRFSPSADWRDPINSSPYLIDRIEMTIDDVIDWVEDTGKTAIPWREVNEEQLLAGRQDTSSDDILRRARERGQLDSANDVAHSYTGYEKVWIHRNIMHYQGRDWIFYTLGTLSMLSDPIPLEQEYPHLMPGERPYVGGFCTLETHRQYPDSPAGMLSGIQKRANDLDNQRFDNVQLTLNRRYFVKRSQGVDIKALQRNAPGGVTLVNNVDQDVRSDAPPDVTSSSYQEQDRINMDFDELAGNFSSSSVGSNQNMNETVGGLELLSGDADLVAEYRLRVFTETWVEKVLKQLVRLEQRHETDEGILAMIGEKVELWQKFGISRIEDKMLQGNMTVEVNVGFGATSPTQRINRLATALGAVAQFAPSSMQRLDEKEIIKEVFASIGWKTGDRFFVPEDPENPPPEQQPDPQVVLEQLRGQNQMTLETARFNNDMQLETYRTQNDVRKEEMGLKTEMSQKAFDMQKFNRELDARREEFGMKQKGDFDKDKMKFAGDMMKEKKADQRFKEELKVKREKGTGI